MELKIVLTSINFTGFSRLVILQNLLNWVAVVQLCIQSSQNFSEYCCRVRLFTNLSACMKQLMQRFIVVDLSNFYFDTAKHRLYTGYAYNHSFTHVLKIPLIEK